jgi:hypothetical protein
MPNGARSSAGGAGAATGGGLQDRILASFAIHLLARESLRAGWPLNGAQLEYVGAQTGQEIDDVGAITDRGGFVLVQSKHNLALSEDDQSDLADAVDQVVRQFILGVPNGAGRRPIEAGKDLLLICTDEEGSSRVTVALAGVIERLAGHPPQLPLDDVATNADERDALRILYHHLSVSWRKYVDGAQPSDDQIREIAKVLRIAKLDLDDGGSDREVAQLRLRPVLEDPDGAAGAWNDLVVHAHELSEERRWSDRAALKNALAAGGHFAGVDHLFTRDVARLREITAAVVQSDSSDLVITAPDSVVAIHREVGDELAEAQEGFALIGVAGAGKSVLTVGLAAARMAAGEDVVYLQAESLRDSLATTAAELDLAHALDRVLQGWEGARPATLVVDGIDATRGGEALDWLPALARSLRGTRWRIVGSVRTFDLRRSPSWQAMFPGEPIDSRHADSGFAHVRHLVVGDLTEGELSQVVAQSALLGTLLEGAEERLRSLLRNPFNLRLAASLLGESPEAVAAVRTRQDLLRLYWERRVEATTTHLQRRRALRDLCESMVRTRHARVVDPVSVVEAAVLGAVDELLHDGVLREDVQGRRLTAAPLVFSHPVLFDFAVAVMCLDDPDDHLHLVRRLDSDPDLAIVARPSVDMRLVGLWEEEEDPNKSAFWEVAVALNQPEGGHPIAAIAAASAVLREWPTYENFATLADLTAEATSKAAACSAIYHLAGALESDDVAPVDRMKSAPALAELAGRLAAVALAANDIVLADAARALLHCLDHCFPLESSAVAADVRAKAVANVMEVALLEPADNAHEQLALRVAELLTRAATVDLAATRPAIERSIAPSTLSQWGGNIVNRQIQPLAKLAEIDADFARQLALAPWAVSEVADEVTPIGGSQILAMSSTRSQDLEMARFGTGIVFPDFLAIASGQATRLLLEILALHGAPTEPLRTTGGLPRVYRSENLQYAAGYDALNTMAKSLVQRLTHLSSSEAGATEAGELLDLLVRELTHAQVWSMLLEGGAAAPMGLGRRLVPLLDGSDILGNSYTHSAAATLISAVSPVLDSEQHATLERAIHAATDPYDPSTGARQELVDALLGKLDRERVQLDSTRERLAELDERGGPPEPAPPPYQFVRWGDIGPTEPEADSTPFTDALNRLRADLAGASSGSSEDQARARERMRESVPELVAILDGSERPEPDDFAHAGGFLLQGAELLASDETVLPDSVLGNKVLGLFIAALPDDGAGAGGHQ